MEQLKCPLCGSEAIELEVIEDGSEAGIDEIGIGPPVCPGGHGLITEEGLLLTREGEVGKGGFVISRGETDSAKITSLLQSIRDLEFVPSSSKNVVDLAQQRAKGWNRKRAKRRFRRWLSDYDNSLPPIPDAELRSLAERLLAEDQRKVQDSSHYWENDDLIRWMEYGLIDQVQRYEALRGSEPVLILAGAIPEDVRHAFDEAKECRRWGLNEACFALCRRIIDIALRSVWPTPVGGTFNTKVARCDALSPEEKTWINRFWERSSNFLHGKEEAGDAWQKLETIAAILQRLAERGAFESR